MSLLKILLLQTCCTLYLLPASQCANILFFIGFGGQSHRLAMEPLANALSDKGHRVSFLVPENPNKIQNKKIAYFVSENVEKFIEKLHKFGGEELNLYQTRKQGRTAKSWFLIPWIGINVCERLYNDSAFMDWIGKEKFDLILIDGLFSDCAYGLAHLHQSKVILFILSSVPNWHADGIGVPDETSSIPDMQFHFPQKMNFWQRTVSAMMPVLWRLYREWYYFPKLEKVTREGQKSISTKPVPDFTELQRNVDLVLVNTHVAQEYPRSLPSNVVPVGGISFVENRKKLPKDLEDFINRGKDGFVYVNFGSYLDFTMFPTEVQQTFLNALGNFSNIQFIWKMKTKPEGLPKNIYVDKWMPQQDILFHPKIKVFLTHSGLGGVNEAIYGAVPLLCFPVFAEQDSNANLVVSKGMGLKMEITEVTEQGLNSALAELLSNNKMYRENINQVRKQFLDRPMKPLETALWYTELVLRHNSTDFMKPLNIQQPWWVKRQIDVWLFVSVVTLLVLLALTYLIWKMVKLVFKLIFKVLFCNRSDSGKSESQTKRVNGNKKQKKFKHY